MSFLTFLTFLSSHGAGAQPCDCKRDRFWVRYPLEEIQYHFCALVSRQSMALSFTIQYAVPPAENAKRSILTLGSLCLPATYSVNLKKKRKRKLPFHITKQLLKFIYF